MTSERSDILNASRITAIMAENVRVDAEQNTTSSGPTPTMGASHRSGFEVPGDPRKTSAQPDAPRGTAPPNWEMIISQMQATISEIQQVVQRHDDSFSDPNGKFLMTLQIDIRKEAAASTEKALQSILPRLDALTQDIATAKSSHTDKDSEKPPPRFRQSLLESTSILGMRRIGDPAVTYTGWKEKFDNTINQLRPEYTPILNTSPTTRKQKRQRQHFFVFGKTIQR